MKGLFELLKTRGSKIDEAVDGAVRGGKKGADKAKAPDSPEAVVEQAIAEVEANDGGLTDKLDELLERIFTDAPDFEEYFPDAPDKSTLLKLLRDKSFRSRLKDKLSEVEQDFGGYQLAEYDEDELPAEEAAVVLKSPGRLV